MSTFSIAAGYTFACGLAASAPTDAADPTQSAYHNTGVLANDVTVNRTRTVIEQRLASNYPNRALYLAEMTALVSGMRLDADTDSNQGLTDLLAAHNSTTLGVGATGQAIYCIFYKGSGDLLWYGIAVVPVMNPVLSKGDLVHYMVDLAFQSITEATQ